jgi:hypothetical protein
MELEYQSYTLSIESKILAYTQTICNSNDLCIICQLDEHEDGKQWNRYKLICGHIFHTRCFRKWTDKKQLINCPYCGDIQQIDRNNFCTSCKIFGHQSDICCLPDAENFFRFHVLMEYVKPIHNPKDKINICYCWKCDICNSKVNNFSFESKKKHFTSKKCINKQKLFNIIPVIE